jgi:hypothetical protein
MQCVSQRPASNRHCLLSAAGTAGYCGMVVWYIAVEDTKIRRRLNPLRMTGAGLATGLVENRPFGGSNSASVHFGGSNSASVHFGGSAGYDLSGSGCQITDSTSEPQFTLWDQQDTLFLVQDAKPVPVLQSRNLQSVCQYYYTSVLFAHYVPSTANLRFHCRPED